ncbi:hypothetical protein BCR34DRAFT_388378 [Clohesyomyces aquaticus]|uniref:Uncharacterized protein n=1 Tax=Clohesyomyces aquaticus TaxID=1231657 RepID=A0A1Y1ZEV3_9PLEO|nr:hypothetical protein BCR34DRAFT_388378 [Clohesyomyces aquaticus]
MDPASVFSIVGAAGSLALNCGKVIHTLYDLAERYKDAEVAILSIIQECRTIELAWSRIERWVATGLDDYEDYEQLGDRLQLSLYHGQLVIAELEKDLFAIQKTPQYSRFRRRTKIVWNGSVLQAHQDRIRGQVCAMMLLLEVIQLPSRSDRADLLSIKEPVFRSVEDSVRSIVPSRISAYSDDASSVRSSGSRDLWYIPFAFENQLFTSDVYKRNFRVPKLRQLQRKAKVERSDNSTHGISATRGNVQAGKSGYGPVLADGDRRSLDHISVTPTETPTERSNVQAGKSGYDPALADGDWRSLDHISVTPTETPTERSNVQAGKSGYYPALADGDLRSLDQVSVTRMEIPTEHRSNGCADSMIDAMQGSLGFSERTLQSEDLRYGGPLLDPLNSDIFAPLDIDITLPAQVSYNEASLPVSIKRKPLSSADAMLWMESANSHTLRSLPTLSTCSSGRNLPSVTCEHSLTGVSRRGEPIDALFRRLRQGDSQAALDCVQQSEFDCLFAPFACNHCQFTSSDLALMLKRILEQDRVFFSTVVQTVALTYGTRVIEKLVDALVRTDNRSMEVDRDSIHAVGMLNAHWTTAIINDTEISRAATDRDEAVSNGMLRHYPTALQLACVTKRTQVVEYLLSIGPPTLAASWTSDPFILATKRRCTSILRLFLELRKAAVTKTIKNHALLMVINEDCCLTEGWVNSDQNDRRACEEDLEIISLLLSNGASPYARDRYGRTALLLARERSDKRSVRIGNILLRNMEAMTIPTQVQTQKKTLYQAFMSDL